MVLSYQLWFFHTEGFVTARALFKWCSNGVTDPSVQMVFKWCYRHLSTV